MALSIIEAAFSGGAEAVAKSALKGAIEIAVEFGVEAVASEAMHAEAGRKLQAAAQQARDKLVSKYSATLTPILAARWPSDPSMPTTIIDKAAWHVAYASVSSSQYNLVTFVEAVLPFDIGGVIKAFDKPLCSIDIPPQSCSEVPAVCDNGGQCSGTWACQWVPHLPPRVPTDCVARCLSLVLPPPVLLWGTVAAPSLPALTMLGWPTCSASRCASGFTGSTCREATGESTVAPDFNADLHAQQATSTGSTAASKPSSTASAGVIAAVVATMVILLSAIIALTHRKSAKRSSKSAAFTNGL